MWVWVLVGMCVCFCGCGSGGGGGGGGCSCRRLALLAVGFLDFFFLYSKTHIFVLSQIQLIFQFTLANIFFLKTFFHQNTMNLNLNVKVTPSWRTPL